MKEVEKIIKKHYGKGKRFKTRGWEQCGQDIEKLIRKKEDQIKEKELPYSQECQEISIMRKKIEDDYESYFEYNGYFNWIDGNSKLKNLLQ